MGSGKTERNKRNKKKRAVNNPLSPFYQRGGATGEMMQGSSSIPRNYLATHIVGVPSSQRQTLAWATNGGITTAALSGYVENAVIVLNSPYDPDAALGGLSAQGFAKWMAFYSKCFVLSARIRVTSTAAGPNFEGIPTGILVRGLTITTNSTAIGSTVQAIQNGMCKWEMTNVNPDRVKFELAVDIAKFVDKPDILDDNQFFCTATANPTQIVCAHLWYQNVTGLATTTINFWIEVEMDCVFTDPIPFV
jgi:hypothetical protein